MIGGDNKKMISATEQQGIALDILRFLDRICRKNNIDYSLIGGSLIGAIRHHGFIPWDDDVDVILSEENYVKLKKILDKETGRYQTMKLGRGGEKYIFTKLVDTRTHVIEKGQPAFDPDYGVYVDIFCYYSTSDDFKKRKKHYKKIKMMVSLITRRKILLKEEPLAKCILCFAKNMCSRLLGYGRIRRMFDVLLNQYSGTKYVVSNWPAYGFEKEIQLKKNTEEYIDVKFEDLTVMVFKNYDEILRTTFGDYMQLPPESERQPRHDMMAWWRGDTGTEPIMLADREGDEGAKK